MIPICEDESYRRTDDTTIAEVGTWMKKKIYSSVRFKRLKPREHAQGEWRVEEESQTKLACRRSERPSRPKSIVSGDVRSIVT